MTDASTRVWLSTAALVVAACVVFWATGLHMPDGLWVLTLAGTFGGSYFLALVLFDDGTC